MCNIFSLLIAILITPFSQSHDRKSGSRLMESVTSILTHILDWLLRRTPSQRSVCCLWSSRIHGARFDQPGRPRQGNVSRIFPLSTRFLTSLEAFPYMGMSLRTWAKSGMPEASLQACCSTDSPSFSSFSAFFRTGSKLHKHLNEILGCKSCAVFIFTSHSPLPRNKAGL